MLAAIAAAGLALRLIYAIAFTGDLRGFGDSAFYHGAATALADGDGFVDPATGLGSALHPPLTALLLAPASVLGLDSWLAHRCAMALVGAATIVAIGLLARRLAGDRAGLLAAALAAVYPALVSSDTAVMAETPFGLFVALALLAAYAYRDRPGARTAALLGVAIGLSALARGEGLLLVVLLALPLCAARRDWRPLAVTVAACALVVAPWSVRNAATFERFVPLSTNEGTLLAGANCDETYRGRDIGSWSIDCVTASGGGDESAAAARYRRQGIDYALDHPERWPLVAAARLGRTLGVVQPIRQAENAEGRGRVIEIAAAPAFWIAAVIAVFGAVALHRRGGRHSSPHRRTMSPTPMVWPLAAAAGLAVAATLVGYGVPRFRQPADIVVIVLAAVAVDAWLRGRAQRDEPEGAAGAGSATASPRAAALRSGTSRLSDRMGRSTT